MVPVFAMAGHSVFPRFIGAGCYACTEADCCFIVEDTFVSQKNSVALVIKAEQRFVADCFNVQPCYCKYGCWRE
jgi:hypothetical protein